MVNILFFAIVNEGHIMQKWTAPTKLHKLGGLAQRIMKKVQGSESVIIRTIQIEGMWVYYFHQQSFLFMLAADGLQRSPRMNNYLLVLAQIFYENYDEHRFPTVMNRIITQINKIQNNESNHEEHQGLISNGYSMLDQKQRISNILAKQDRNSRRAYIVSAILFICIVALGINYIYRRT